MLKILDMNSRSEWEKIVRSFQEYDCYWLPSYILPFQIHGDGEPILFYWEDGEGSRAINAVMKRDIAKDSHFYGKIEENKYFDLATPYGYGGWLVEGNANYEKEYVDYCQQHQIVSEFVRWHPQIDNQRFNKDSYEIIPLGQTVSMDVSTPDVIFSNLTSKNRNMIRKAEKNGITISNGWSAELLEIFKKIYDGTMQKDNAASYYYFEDPFYHCLLNEFNQQEATVFYAELDKKIIAACIIFCVNGFLNYHLSGSLQEYSSLASSNLMLYQAALWGCERGCRTFHLGGGVGSQIDGLFRFKKSFNRSENLNQFYIGKKIFDYNEYNHLVSIRNGIEESNYFPRYRA